MSESSFGSPENVVGKIIVVALMAYVLVHFNYEISQFLMSRWDAWWDARGGFFSDMERAGDDAGILGSLILLILYIILGLLSALLLLAIAGAVWVVGKLNEVYILPFVLTVLVVYSKFSYSFIAKPFGRLIYGILGILRWFGRSFLRMLQTFVFLPIAEVISGDKSPAYRVYRVATSLLFMVGAICLILGVGGVAAHYAKKYNFSAVVENVVGGAADEVSPETYKQDQYQIVLKASKPHWTSTGIHMKKGDRFSVNARGQGTYMYPRNYPGQVRPITVTPDGMRNVVGSGEFMLPSRFPNDFRRRGWSPNNFILPDKPIYGLIGKIGTGKPFYVGSFVEDKADYDGELLLGANQLWRRASDWANNKGEYQITVIVKRR